MPESRLQRVHVIYTPGTVRVLLPFALSLLREPRGCFVLVDNGCSPPESEAIRQLAATETRLDYLRLPSSDTARHGVALEQLLARERERDSERFAALDSDVIASGPFLAELEAALENGSAPAAACGAWPIWVEDRESVCPSNQPFLGGPYRTLADGTEVGGTSCVLYDREALEGALAASGLGLADRGREELPSGLAARLARRGWRFERFGTARIAHLELIDRGRAICNVDCDSLHHLGGLSHTAELGRRRAGRRLLRGPRSPARNLVVNLGRRLGGGGRARSAVYRRKERIVADLGAILAELAAGAPAAAPRPSGSAEVDVRLRRLVEVLAADYPRHRQRLAAIGIAGPDPVAAGAP